MNLPDILKSYPDLEITAPAVPGDEIILTRDAVGFLVDMVNRFSPELTKLLAARETRQAEFDQGALPGFDPATSDIRDGDWLVAPIPDDIADRRTEITGPVT